MSEIIWIETPEGDEICGEMHIPDGKREGTVLLNHGFTSGKSEYGNEADYLKDNGYEAFRWDRRGYGDSTGKREKDIKYATVSSGIEDLGNVVDYLKREWSLEEGLAAYGSSFGGKITLHYAARNPEEFDALTLRATGPYFDLIREGLVNLVSDKEGYSDDEIEIFMEDLKKYDGEKAAKQIQNPTILFHGNSDNKVEIENSQQLLDDLKVDKGLIVFKGWGHDFDEDDEMRKKTLDLTMDWFKEHL